MIIVKLLGVQFGMLWYCGTASKGKHNIQLHRTYKMQLHKIQTLVHKNVSQTKIQTHATFLFPKFRLSIYLSSILELVTSLFCDLNEFEVRLYRGQYLCSECDSVNTAYCYQRTAQPVLQDSKIEDT